MRINSINSSIEVASIYNKNKINKVESKKVNEVPKDRIEISSAGRSLVGMDSIEIDESAKVERIKELIKNENYQVDSKKLAKAMLGSIRNMGD
ncbi:flagellar biosynthesis anti-sigma factor FlgM [uncultured Clostridium sp.]|jgi:flagellar biosynthesis anti-sigma factor FlgM|uniref:flagellar biosynthesis anti-sigma factor FlgM n=1 Tax=uncultured Clostridium sp. TaxID=59620 RepID=UPI002637D083|nr:flagellar biosynthesis anti-sigma factor FlgM [uncultured Clostridium sp.]